MKKIAISLLALVVLGSCSSEDDASEIVLLVTQSARQAEGGEKIYFDIEARTTHVRMERLEIASFDASSGQRELFCECPGTERYSTRYVYTAPILPVDSLTVELTFTAADDCGCTRQAHRQLVVRNSAAPLVEKSGYTLYSPDSGGFDGFSLAELRPLKSTESEPENVDFYVCPSAEGSDILGREWRSLNGTKFAKVNNFNYAEATRASVVSLYENSRCDDFVSDLAIDDVILLGRGEQAGGILKIVAVCDDPGSESDRYLFNLKVVE